MVEVRPRPQKWPNEEASKAPKTKNSSGTLWLCHERLAILRSATALVSDLFGCFETAVTEDDSVLAIDGKRVGPAELLQALRDVADLAWGT